MLSLDHLELELDFQPTYSFFGEVSFVTCEMLFSLSETYIKFSYGNTVWNMLGMRADSWSKCKKAKHLSKKHYRALCRLIGHEVTENDRELCEAILKKYLDEREGV